MTAADLPHNLDLPEEPDDGPAPAPTPRWRRVVSILITAYLVLTSLQFVMMIGFSASGGSMDLQAGVSPGVLMTGTFHYRYHNVTKGRTVDLPVAPADAGRDIGRVTVDPGTTITEDVSDFGPFGPDGRGSVALPRDVTLDRELNGTALLQPLRTGSRLTLGVNSPVGWRGRLLVALPSVLIWAGLWIATVSFGRFLRSIVNGRPFEEGNVRRLLWIAGSLAGVLFADSWLRVWIVRAMFDVLARHGRPIPLLVDGPGVNVGLIYVIVGVLALAAAFRAGQRLVADTDGLV